MKTVFVVGEILFELFTSSDVFMYCKLVGSVFKLDGGKCGMCVKVGVVFLLVV